MTTYKDPKTNPPTPGVEYWVMREDLKPFRVVRSIFGSDWMENRIIVYNIILYAEIKPPPLTPINPDSASEAMRLLGLLAINQDAGPPLGIVTEFLSDLAANIRADEHDRVHDFYVKFDQAAAELAQHERTRDAAIIAAEKAYSIFRDPVSSVWNVIKNSIKNMEKP